LKGKSKARANEFFGSSREVDERRTGLAENIVPRTPIVPLSEEQASILAPQGIHLFHRRRRGRSRQLSSSSSTNARTSFSTAVSASSGSAQSRSSTCQYSTCSSHDEKRLFSSGRCSASFMTITRSDATRSASETCRGNRNSPTMGIARVRRRSTVWCEIGPILPARPTPKPRESARHDSPAHSASQLNRCSAKRLR
jgi:hypothetical protein